MIKSKIKKKMNKTLISYKLNNYKYNLFLF